MRRYIIHYYTNDEQKHSRSFETFSKVKQFLNENKDKIYINVDFRVYEKIFDSEEEYKSFFDIFGDENNYEC